MKASTVFFISSGVWGYESFDEIPSDFVPKDYDDFDDDESLEPDCCYGLSWALGPDPDY